MVFFIEVVDGPLAGSRYKIEDGITIGRSRGEIVIEDSKISSAHASFARDNKDQFILNDLGSANGILTGNRRVRKLAMMPGVVFRLGATSFTVVQVEDTMVAEDFARIKTWKENLAEKLLPQLIPNIPPKQPVQVFSPSVTLKFLQGVQAGQSIQLGYGPRRFGAHCLDIDLLDPQAPELAFELRPGVTMAKIENLCDHHLSINGHPVTNQELQDGDLIKFGRTLIKVTYI